VWLPRFACPECERSLVEAGIDCLVCAGCGRTYQRRDGVWRFLTPAAAARLAPFVDQYRAVRAAEGRRSLAPDQYRRLPAVAADDPHAREWRIRRETYGHLLRRVLAAEQPSMTILDLGAGSAWLAHRLASLGHRVVAADVVADPADGVGVVRHYASPIVAVQADFDALPLAAEQFDLVVFNASLHYSPDAAATLAHARRLLSPDGTLAVMDSPIFPADDDGDAMVEEESRTLSDSHGLEQVIRPGRGYLTFPALQAVADALHMRAAFVPSRGPFAWRIRRSLSRLTLGRRPAAFGLWVAR
jgi:SAM-dependent methyltransferase